MIVFFVAGKAKFHQSLVFVQVCIPTIFIKIHLRKSCEHIRTHVLNIFLQVCNIISKLQWNINGTKI